MSTIRVVRGSGTGPTAMSSFDAALADAGVHNYNILSLSSVVPADATVEVVGTAPDLGPTGEALYCVESRETLVPGADGPACAALGWARTDSGEGLFYEASGTDPEAVRRAVESGLTAGMGLRDWPVRETEVVVESTPAAADAHTTAVALAAYGGSHLLL